MLSAIENWKEKISYQSASLAICSGLAALLLAVTQTMTTPVIAQRVAEDQSALLVQVVPDAEIANDVFAQGTTISNDDKSYQLYDVKDKAGNVTNYVIRGVEDGYGGPITFLIGTDIQGAITGVRILSHSETPGLGDKIDIEKTNWVTGFNQRSLANTPVWAVKKDGGDFDQFSGATITPRSVVRGIHNAMLALKKYTESNHE